MKVVPLEALNFTQETEEKKWSSYCEEEYIGTYIMLPKFLKIFRGKSQQILNQRVFIYENCNMCVGEIICFVLILTGLGLFFGFAYGDDSLSGTAASVPLSMILFHNTSKFSLKTPPHFALSSNTLFFSSIKNSALLDLHNKKLFLDISLWSLLRKGHLLAQNIWMVNTSRWIATHGRVSIQEKQWLACSC